MTADEIRLAKGFDAQVIRVATAQNTIVTIAPGDANRVGIMVTYADVAALQIGATAVVGVRRDGGILGFGTVNFQWPNLLLGVTDVGSLLFEELVIAADTTTTPEFAVTLIRQVQELPPQ